jgi:hypothetical protein
VGREASFDANTELRAAQQPYTLLAGRLRTRGSEKPFVDRAILTLPNPNVALEDHQEHDDVYQGEPNKVEHDWPLKHGKRCCNRDRNEEVQADMQPCPFLHGDPHHQKDNEHKQRKEHGKFSGPSG